MKQSLFHGILPLMCVLASVLISACDNKPNYSFKSPEEAVTACKTKLSNLKSIEQSSIDNLGELICDWQVLEDSAYNCFIADSISESANMLINDFFIISDSIRAEIVRIATSESRSFRDVLHLKLLSVKNEKAEARKSKAFIEASNFYRELPNQIDENSTITLENYHELLTTTAPFSTEGEMLSFISKEDKCFRSILYYILEVSQEDLQEITSLTAGFFDELTQTVSENLGDSQSDRIRMYLTMRFNRRIIQNAETCARFIKQGVALNEQQAANFKWMVIQPFFSIDNYSMSLISEEQEKALYKLSDEVVELLARIDNGGEEPSKAEVSKLSEILTEYFLKSYLRLNL